MTEPKPGKVVEIVLGLDERYCFMNFADPDRPRPLFLDLSERCSLVFTLSDQLISAGWRFQRRPIEVQRDFGVNFSSYVWLPYSIDGGELAHRSRFKIIYEDQRIGMYTYSLLMVDPHGQRICLDPDIDNGAGHTP
jgi:hypothetical protein